MVELYRLFKTETRTLTNQQHKYAGQVGDALSTVLHFAYEPENIIETEGYTPYIIFNVYDCKNRPLVYSPHSQHKFDGYEFKIPWEVTSRIKNNRLEYQILLLKSDIEFDGYVVNLGETEYLLSNLDGIAYKKSVQVERCGCGGLNPGMEPSLFGWLNFWKEYGLIKPVEYERKAGGDGGRLVFRLVNQEPFYVEIPDAKGTIAYDGRITITSGNMKESFTVNQKEDKTIEVPAPNDAKITLRQNGVEMGSFTVNQKEDKTIDLTGGGGGGETILAYTEMFGNLTDRTYEITHPLASLDVICNIKKSVPTDDGFEFVKAQTFVVNSSKVKIVLDHVPTEVNEFTVTIFAHKNLNEESNGQAVIPFGNLTDKVYTLTHGLNTTTFTYAIRKTHATDDGMEFVDAKVFVLDGNRVRIKLRRVPTETDEFTFVAISKTE